MSELHTVNKSPFEKTSAASCLAHVAEGSAVLFYEDGVYAAMDGTTISAQVKGAGVKVYALGPDLAARGIAADRLMEGVEVVDYAGFVDLAAEYSKVVAWV
jgi:tRNA 2-thiouridine synthesizing protein B